MTDRMSNERIAELAAVFSGVTECALDPHGASVALRQTRADLAQAESTIAERDAEIARLLSELEATSPTTSGSLTNRAAIKEAKHDQR